MLLSGAEPNPKASIATHLRKKKMTETATTASIVTAKPRYVLRPQDLESYCPANHTGTRNTRLVSAALNGAKHMEVVLGEVDKGAGVSMHAHPGMEQAQYFIEGEAEVVIDGEMHYARAGDLCFFPPDVFHSVRVTSERMKVLIIYSPPYAEDPAKIVRQ
jgi:quercetin dioxygenase-like cupin family protein